MGPFVPHRIIEWKSTSERYVAIVQSAERFEPNSLREIRRGPLESWIVGRLKGTVREDLYALGFSRAELEYGEARERAKAVLDRYNALLEEGKDPIKDW